VQPDIMSFAKGVTCGYLPLGGIQVSDTIREAILHAPPDQRWMHAYTYSGHATCCAVALKNLEILARDNLVEQAALMGERLQSGVQALMAEFECIGNVRGLGLMCAVEFVADRETKASAQIANKILQSCLENGLLTRTKGESLLLAPPLIVVDEEIDQILEIVRQAIATHCH
jgi:adenosylmethionine-8-amino-7-oxononanoate aminotransferase